MNYEDHQANAQRERDERAAFLASNLVRASKPAAVRDAEQRYPGAQPAVVVDINMSFGSMVKFMVKWAIAAIPALIILFILANGFLAIFSLIFR